MEIPAKPVSPIPMAKVIVLTQWGVIPTRVEDSIFSDAALTAFPISVFLRKRLTPSAEAMAIIKAINRVKEILSPRNVKPKAV